VRRWFLVRASSTGRLFAGNGKRSGFGVAKSDNDVDVVAKLMFAARDPGLDGLDVRAVLRGESAPVEAPKETVLGERS
jgi:hypothetical protein